MHLRTAPPKPVRQAQPAAIVLAGAHGGAGVSTLAGLLRPAWDAGVIRAPATGEPLPPLGWPVVLVTRNTVTAAGQAIDAMQVITAPAMSVAALVVVSDGFPEPPEARYRFRVLGGRVGAVIRMPFVPAFRLAVNPLQVRLPRKASVALASIRALAHEQAPGPVTRSTTVKETA